MTVDADTFSRLARQALAASPGSREAAKAAADAVGLYEDDLLPSERYAEWVVPLRERLRRDYLLLLDLLADFAATSGDSAAAITYARRRLDADRHDEDAYVRLARLLLDEERWRQAEQVIADGIAVAAELGLPPSAGLERVAARLAEVMRR